MAASPSLGRRPVSASRRPFLHDGVGELAPLGGSEGPRWLPLLRLLRAHASSSLSMRKSIALRAGRMPARRSGSARPLITSMEGRGGGPRAHATVERPPRRPAPRDGGTIQRPRSAGAGDIGAFRGGAADRPAESSRTRAPPCLVSLPERHARPAQTLSSSRRWFVDRSRHGRAKRCSATCTARWWTRDRRRRSRR